MGLGFAVSEIARRRADKFGDLVLHLKFAAIDFQETFLAAVQRFGKRLTVLVLPVPVGPSRRNTPTGRPSAAKPARYICT